MSTSVSSLSNNFFPSAENGFTTTTSGSVSSGAATVGLNSVAGYTNGEVAVFVIDPTDVSKKQTFTGVIDTAGVQVTDVVWTAGTNQTHALGATVVDYATATHISMITKGLIQEHNQDGTHGAVTATSLVTTQDVTVGDDLTVTGDVAVTGPTTLTGALTIKSYDGWITTTDTWTYASATTFTISGVDRTAQFPVGTKIKLTQTTAKYFYVTASSFSTNTTVTVTGGSDYSLANAAITSPLYSYMETPQGFPSYFNYTAAITAATTDPTYGTSPTQVGHFKMNGKRVTCSFQIIFGTGSPTAGTGNYYLNLPVTAQNSVFTNGNVPMKSMVRLVDNSTSTNNIGYVEYETTNINSKGAGNVAQLISMVVTTNDAGVAADPVVISNVSASAPWTWAASDQINGELEYEAA